MNKLTRTIIGLACLILHIACTVLMEKGIPFVGIIQGSIAGFFIGLWMSKSVD